METGLRLTGLLIVLLGILVVAPVSGATYNPATGHWYELTPVLEDWEACEAYAVGLGGHLVTVNDAVEEAWLVTTFGNDRLWIGFNDVAQEGTWVWSSGETPGYTNWASGEPNSGGVSGDDEDYAVLNWLSWEGSKWNDWDPPSNGHVEISGIAEYSEASVPEPTSLVLWSGLGLMGVLGTRLRRRSANGNLRRHHFR